MIMVSDGWSKATESLFLVVIVEYNEQTQG
jgi:hypothetical protein